MEVGITTEATPWDNYTMVIHDVQPFLDTSFSSTPVKTTAYSGTPSRLRGIVAAITVGDNFPLASPGRLVVTATTPTMKTATLTSTA